ncbi:MAG: gliding motility-associated C-terminal domain-containing protein, partial [Bacteroidota bacterium]
YRRIVESGMCIDTSNFVTIQVLDQIGNNLIEADHKICYATEANVLTDNGDLTGGNKVDYNFIWEYSHNQQVWNRPSANNNKTYEPGVLYDTTFFRRITNSSACWDTSNYVKITVVPEIFNPVAFSDTTICQHYYPDAFVESPASGGNNVFDYTWQQSHDLAGWQTAAGDADNPSYQAPKLQDTTFYRRMVQSDICTVFSDTIKVAVMPEIDNNLIEAAPLTYTCFEIPKLLVANEPVGGEGIYRYLWEESKIAANWDPAKGEDSTHLEYKTPALQDSMYYRRIVKSGEYNQCMDTSEYVLVRINPLPTGILSDVDTMVCDLQPVPLEVSFSGEAPWRVYLSDGTDYTMNEESGFITKTYESTNVSQLVSLVIDSLVDANGCRATNLVGLTQIASYENPDPEILAAPNACENQSQVIAKTPKFPAHWKGDNLHFLDSTAVNTSVVSSVYDLPQSAIWYEINNFCFEADTAEMVFYKQPMAETTFGDTTIHHTFHLELETPVPQYDSVVWYALEDDVSIADAGATYANFVFPYENYQNYTLIYRINNGLCYASDTLSITMKDILYPNAFSPNGDGINDYFYIEGIDDEVNKKLTVINPWGNIVFTEPNYTSDNRWDGKDMDGRDLPEGTYYYIFETDNKEPKKGFIILKRSEAGN